MADQAKVTGGNSSPLKAAENVVGGLAEFGNDFSTLIELQAKLAAMDLEQSMEHAAAPLIAMAVAVPLALAALPVLLIGLAFVVGTLLKIGPGVAMLLTAGVILILTGAIAAFALARTLRSFRTFQRSREELVRNISWVRSVLVHSGRTVPRPRR